VDDVNYLFRKTPRHIFITTKDPEFRYELLCGRCEYPLAEEDNVCPRCQMELEECPVCTDVKHMKAPKVRSEPSGMGHTCPVCKVRRIPFGDKTLADLRGSFCTNLYGCPAGGLLLKKGEFGLLPDKASICPVCHHDTLKPLGVEAFAYHLQRCIFCNTCFGPASSWAKGWTARPSLEVLGEVAGDHHTPCPLCGRNDHQDPQTGRVISVSVDRGEGEQPMDLLAEHYLRICELGRILILDKEDDEAFVKAFYLWFDSGVKGFDQDFITVGHVVDHLIDGTLKPELRQTLQRRLDRFLENWKMKLGPEGVGYQIGIHRPPKPKMYQVMAGA
jgi:RNA polymerase subunit RPABC4/transcription elongation factor Spt4